MLGPRRIECVAIDNRRSEVVHLFFGLFLWEYRLDMCSFMFLFSKAYIRFHNHSSPFG